MKKTYRGYRIRIGAHISISKKDFKEIHPITSGDNLLKAMRIVNMICRDEIEYTPKEVSISSVKITDKSWS